MEQSVDAPTAMREFVPLEAVLLQDELGRRPIRRPDVDAENAAYLMLADDLHAGPERLLQSLMDAAVSLCGAGSAGVSLLEPPDLFRWTVLSGRMASAVNGTTPRDFSPCGVCLDHDAPVLFSHPDRHFMFLQKAGVPFVEALVLPFHAKGKAVGTIWIVSHDYAGQFDMEDVRIMTRLARFTGDVYAALAERAIAGDVAVA